MKGVERMKGWIERLQWSNRNGGAPFFLPARLRAGDDLTELLFTL